MSTRENAPKPVGARKSIGMALVVAACVGVVVLAVGAARLAWFFFDLVR